MQKKRIFFLQGNLTGSQKDPASMDRAQSKDYWRGTGDGKAGGGKPYIRQALKDLESQYCIGRTG